MCWILNIDVLLLFAGGSVITCTLDCYGHSFSSCEGIFAWLTFIWTTGLRCTGSAKCLFYCVYAAMQISLSICTWWIICTINYEFHLICYRPTAVLDCCHGSAKCFYIACTWYCEYHCHSISGGFHFWITVTSMWSTGLCCNILS